jgi:hypothetical protein
VTDLPPDVERSLAQLLSEGEEHARRRETAEALEVVESVARVAETEVPDGDLRRTLLHGCARVHTTAADEPLVAAEYLRSMTDVVADAARSGG